MKIRIPKKVAAIMSHDPKIAGLTLCAITRTAIRPANPRRATNIHPHAGRIVSIPSRSTSTRMVVKFILVFFTVPQHKSSRYSEDIYRRTKYKLPYSAFVDFVNLHLKERLSCRLERQVLYCVLSVNLEDDGQRCGLYPSPPQTASRRILFIIPLDSMQQGYRRLCQSHLNER